MKKWVAVILTVFVLLSTFSLCGSATDALETIEFEGKTYINVNKKEVLDSLIYEMIDKRETHLDVYCYHDQRDWEDAYPRDVSNFIGFGRECIFDYLTYTVGSVGLYTYPKYTDTGFTKEAYGTIEIRYLDTKEETAKADVIIDGVLKDIASYDLVKKLRFIADYVCKSTEYGSIKIDGGYDMINGAWDVLSGVRTNTVCTSYAVTFQRFMDRAGIPCYMTSNNNHIWNMVEIDGLWYGIDFTSDAGDAIYDNAFLMGSDSLKRYPAGKLDPVGTFGKDHPISKEDYGKAVVTTKPATTTRRPTTTKPKATQTTGVTTVNTTTAETTTNTTTTTFAMLEMVETLAGDTTVDASVFQSAATLDVPLTLEADTYSWTFSADALASYAETVAFDAAIVTGGAVSESDRQAIENATDAETVFPFSFAHHGQLPAKATVQIKVNDAFAGKMVDVYSLNEQNQPVLETTVTVSNDAVLTFDTIHCSVWYAVEHTDKAPSLPIVLWIGIAAFVIAVAVIIVIVWRKK